MDANYDPRLIVDDARHRHSGVVSLIHLMDTRAMALLRAYVTIGVASAAGSVGLLLTPSPSLPVPVGWALLAVVISLALGSYWCFRVMRTAPINISGRKGDFWLWAMDERIPTAAVLRAYLEDSSAKTDQNSALNAEMTSTFERAKWAGMLAPVAAMLAGCIATLVVRLSA